MIDAKEMQPGIQALPLVAIIGRPNVGKSTLFNRLLGKRLAITDPTPGVTRDPIPSDCLLGGHFITLVDSGGIKLEQEGLDSQVSEKSLALLEKSNLILFLMDCMEVTAEDYVLLDKLRPYTDKVLLVVNKIDSSSREGLIWEYYGFGYQRVVGISAAHGLGVDNLEEMMLGMLNLEETNDIPEKPKTVKIAVLGKPNTGKSTLTNLLVGSDLSIVSDIAGTTRDVVRGAFTYKGTDFTVLDTAGIRRKSKVDESVEYYSVNRAIKTIEEADVVLLMIDATEGLSDQDKKIAALVVRKGKGIILVLNKIDKLSGIPNELDAIKDRVRFLFPILSFAPICAISARNGDKISIMLDEVWAVWRQLNKRITTSSINDALKAWGENYTPPRGAEGHYKVFYGTQVTVTPIRFLFFVNRIKGFPDLYVKYLTNCVRKDLGFSKVPVGINLRERQRNKSLNEKGEKPILSKSSKPTAPAKRTGGRAVAKERPRKPGNKAALGKAIDREKARQKSKHSIRRKG
ncbi:MAG: ribosome biogenesis GTPase Der [Spirochaetia bacterium]|jgi:GTP-binding protein|nr:ribosome biogenesis GTPase Der [Spirochaetia bacterium]